MRVPQSRPVATLQRQLDRVRLSRWYALALFAGTALLLYVIVAAFVAHPVSFYTGPRWLGGWVRNDAGWYRSIADNGYFFKGETEQSSVAFFPLYPLLTRWLSDALGGDPSAWGVLITLLSGFGAAMLFWHWATARLALPAARTALAVLVVWPYAMYLYGAVYADALFVFLVLAAFVSIEHDRVPLAAVFGALATATRPVGVAVVAGLTARVLEQRGVLRLALLDRVRWFGPTGARAGAPEELRDPATDEGRRVVVEPRRLRVTDPMVLLSVSGLLLYMVYLWQKFDDPFAFATAEAAPGWDQRPGPKVWFKTAWASRLIHLPGSGPRYFAIITLQAVLVLGLVLLVPRVVKRFGWAYGAYTLALLAFPLVGSKDFQGLGRYALGAFPAFAAAGELLAERPRLRRAWFLFAFCALCGFSASLARDGYVA
jgi:hypothetical protein